MGFWPEWWPKNPVGDAWDSFGTFWKDFQWVVYALIIAVVVIVVIALFLRIRGR